MHDQAGQSGPGVGYIFSISMVAAIAGLLFGFDTGIIAGALTFISKSMGIAETDTMTKEAVVAAVTLGALFGAMASSKCSDYFGRKKSIIITSLLFTIGTLCIAMAFHVYMVITGRLIMGFAVGLSAMVAPMYISEVSPPNVRGAVVFLFQLAITIGIMLAYIIDYAFEDTGDWRMMFGVGLIPSVLLGLGMIRLPESPRWLVLKGKVQQAEAVLKKLRGDDFQTELEEIRVSVSHPQGGLRDLFTPKLFPLVVITFGLFVFQQVSGVNTIFYYGPELFKEAGFSAPILASVVCGGTNVLASVVGVWVVDRLGRRKLLFMGFIGVIVCLTVLGAAYKGFFGPNIHWLSLAAVLGFIVFFAIGLGGAPYIIMSELFPLTHRSAGMATASCANWGFNMLVSATFLSLVQGLGMGTTFWLYAACSVGGLIFTIFLVPETKGRPLEEIEANLYAGKKSRHLGDPVEDGL